MSKDLTSPEELFSDLDRLQLVQLATRRVMAERRAVSADKRAETDTAATQESPAERGVPERWRLVPEGLQLHAWQRECLDLWLAKGRGTVKVATGGGKTILALAAAERLQAERAPDLRLVIVVPTIPLMFQWRDELAASNLPASSIGYMGGGQELPPADELRVLICVLNSARDLLPKFVKKAGWASRMLLVVDECHRANATQAQRIFDTRPAHALGLSATPEQETSSGDAPDADYEAGPVGQALGPIIFDFTLRQSLAAGLLTPFEVWHVGLPLTPSEAREHAKLSDDITELRQSLQARHQRSRSKQSFLPWCQTQASRGGAAAAEAERFIGLANQRKRLLYQAAARKQVALELLQESARDPDGRAIVFHESIAEIEDLFLAALERDLPVVLEHSQLPASLRAESIEAFRKGVARGIISAKSLVEGFNVPSADLGIIAASSGSVRQRIQSLGRMLRRKAGDRAARIFILYVRDTQDETIYERADWEDVVGAERNRYFHWTPPGDDDTWSAGLQELGEAPRKYLPPSWEVDVSALAAGSPYPGRPDGIDLRVDQAGNLRTADEVLVETPLELRDQILAHDPQRRARLTPAGHLLVRQRTDDRPSGWLYLSEFVLQEVPASTEAIRLKLQSVRGRRVIGREASRRKGDVAFARRGDQASTPDAAEAADRLLGWIATVEEMRGTQVRELYWDGTAGYWLELDGERIPGPEALAPLDFGS